MSTITTLLPTYRRPKLLRRAIESVLKQTYPHFFLYVFDNASMDETSEVVKEYQKKDARIHYFCNPTNVGLVHNFALSLRHVQTPFFSFLSDDDYLLPDFYELALEGFTQHSQAGFSICKTLNVNEKGRYYPYQFHLRDLCGYFEPPYGLLELLKLKALPTWTGILYKKEILKKIGGLDPQTGILADMDFTIRSAIAFPYIITSKPGAVFVVWKNSTSVLTDTDDYSYAVVRENLKECLKEHPCLMQESLKKIDFHELAGIKCYWIRFLLANNQQGAQKARKAFFLKGGKMPLWMHACLVAAEKNLICHVLFTSLYYMKERIYSLRAFFLSH